MAVTSDSQVASGSTRLSVIVTGGASGIGLEIVRLFASQGHMIAILDVNCTTGKEVVSLLSKEFPNTSLSFKWCDVSSWEGQYAVFEQAYREHGNRIDVVVANAGISEPGAGAFDCVAREFPVKPQLKMQDINLNGVMYSSNLAVHYMLKNEIGSRLPNSRGSIVCTASAAAIYPFPVSPIYAASKSGMVGFIRSIAIRLQESHIQINALAPGVLQTNITPDQELFKKMVITPMSTMTRAVSDFVTDATRTGQVAELHGDTVTLRPHAEYADADVAHNNRMFWELGHA
ncbi:NAD(P)-binding protein [Sarocladium strictum]